MTTRFLPLVVVCCAVASAGGCPIPANDAPAFGRACNGDDCPAGYFCDALRGACLAGEPPPPANIASFTVDLVDVRPQTDVTFSWSATDADSCTLTLDDPGLEDTVIEDVISSGTKTTEVVGPGDVTATLTCLGTDGKEASTFILVHVRKVHEGTLILGSQEDVDANLDVEEVDGDVTAELVSILDVTDMQVRFVHGELRFDGVEDLAELDLLKLEAVDGGVFVNFIATLQAVTLPELRSIGEQPVSPDNGSFIVKHCDTLKSIQVPRLEVVGGDVAWSTYDYPNFPTSLDASPATLPQLETITAPSLQSIGGWLDIEDAVALNTLSVPVLQSIGGSLVLYGNLSLASIPFGALTSCGSILFDRNGGLTADSTLAIDLGSLATVSATEDFQQGFYERFYDEALATGYFRAGDVRMLGNAFIEPDSSENPDDNSAIHALDLSSLQTVAGRLEIQGTRLEEIDLGALEDVGGLLVTSNDFMVGPVTLTALRHVGPHGLVLPNGDILEGLANLESVDGELFLSPKSMGSLDRLTTVGGEFGLDALTQEELLSFPVLSEVGSLHLNRTQGTSTITNVRLPSLTTVGTLDLQGNAINGLELCGLQSATTVRIEQTSITTLDGLASLQQVGTLSIRNHVLLPQCLVDALAAQSSPTTNTSASNAGTAPTTCAIGDTICN